MKSKEFESLLARIISLCVNANRFEYMTEEKFFVNCRILLDDYEAIKKRDKGMEKRKELNSQLHSKTKREESE